MVWQNYVRTIRAEQASPGFVDDCFWLDRAVNRMESANSGLDIAITHASNSRDQPVPSEADKGLSPRPRHRFVNECVCRCGDAISKSSTIIDKHHTQIQDTMKQHLGRGSSVDSRERAADSDTKSSARSAAALGELTSSNDFCGRHSCPLQTSTRNLPVSDACRELAMVFGKSASVK